MSSSHNVNRDPVNIEDAEKVMDDPQVDSAALLAPVTAVDFIQDLVLLSGEGPVLTAYTLEPIPRSSASLSVLQHHRIHGVRPRARSSTTESDCYHLLVFGGKAVRLLRLRVDLQNENHPLHLETSGPLVELQDWALDVRWHCGDEPSLLCVALAHNAALLLDVSTGAAVRQRSCVEGCLLYSALVVGQGTWEDRILVGGTVFNQLVLWKLGEDGGPESKAPVERRLLGHSGVIFNISYLEEKGWLASASDDRSVRVWAVGALGGPGGTCGDLNPVCLRVLFGHQARVFSVRLSPGRVFSAGEDGACLVWDCTRGWKVAQTLKGHRAGGVRSLAVSEGEGERWVATGGADGGVRLWRVKETEERIEETEEETQKTEMLMDLNFPKSLTPKAVCLLRDQEGESWSRAKVLVCTDSGSVYQFTDGLWQVLWAGPPDFQSFCVMETVCVTASVNLCAVGNLSGSVHVFITSCPQRGILLSVGSGKIHSLVWEEGPSGMCLLASGAGGLVHRWCVEVKSSDLNLTPLPPFLLPPCAKRWLLAAVCLQRPQGALWVCGDRRGSLLLYQDSGKRGGGAEEEEEEEDEEHNGLRPVSCLFGVHGKQGVTSLSEHGGRLYSSGRDGAVRVSVVRANPEAGSAENQEQVQLEVLRVQKSCKGMDWLEKVLILQPDAQQADTESRFVIAGFHGVHFVILDPLRQERLFSVACGGGHRSWALWPPHRKAWPGFGTLVFIKHGAVLASRLPAQEASGVGGAGGWNLREGIHGRGIGCVCRLGRIQGSGVGEQWEVVVTGGEDTSLVVMAIHPSSSGVRVLSVITDHISNVRTVAAMTRPEGRSHSLSALLLSAGGRAQVQCYRLLIGWDGRALVPTCQVIQVGGHRLDELWERRRGRHKMVKMDPETRYMCAVVVEQTTDVLLLALACSDGAVRLFSVSEVKRHIHLLWETFHHQRCVLSVATCSLEDGGGNRYQLLFSAATDGNVAVWDLTLSSDPISAPPAPCLHFLAHQSGVNSLAVHAEDPAPRDGGCLVTVASGGDDGQLTVSTIEVQYPEDGGDAGGSREHSSITHRLRLRLRGQAHVPLAHAAPLTALRLLTPDLVVTASSDQRVRLWRTCSTGIGHTKTLFCHVADAAGLCAWPEPMADRGRGEREGGACERQTAGERGGETGWVLVCGHGLQLLRVSENRKWNDGGKGAFQEKN